jgi:subtilisin-like proprotein convertase family protein
MTTLRHIFRAVLAAGLGVTGLVVVTAAGADAATVACQRTYSNTMDFAIPDDSNVTSTIDVDENGLVVSDVDLSLDIDHTYDGDLEIWLYSRTDTSTTRHTARMINRDGDGSDNFTGTVLDDEASTPVSWGSPPFTGRFQPNQKLSAFDGEVGGRYSLFAADRQSGDTGTLRDWSLTFTYASCDFDSDGVEDHADQCLGIAAHTATGCPLTSRTGTAKYQGGKFRGALASPVGGCAAGRLVTVWKVRGGADKKIGTATTKADGSYRLKRARHVGKYYATSPLVAVTDSAECPAVTSKNFRIG